MMTSQDHVVSAGDKPLPIQPAMTNTGLQHRPRGQQGYLLLTTLGLMVFFTVTVIALLGMTITTVLTTKGRITNSQQLRAADSALEKVVNTRRMDLAHPGVACPGTSNNLGIVNSYLVDLDPPEGTITFSVVQCETVSESPSGRQFVLRSYIGSRLMGMAKVNIEDQPDPGVSLTVCDWQLGNFSGNPPANCP